MDQMKFTPSDLDDSSPFRDFLGFELIDWKEGFAKLVLELRPEHANRKGIPHGGVYASLLDSAMGYAGCFTGDREKMRFTLTVSMNVQFIAPPSGQVLTVEGFRVGGGKRTYFAEARIIDDTGVLVATATGVFKQRDQA